MVHMIVLLMVVGTVLGTSPVPHRRRLNVKIGEVKPTKFEGVFKYPNGLEGKAKEPGDGRVDPEVEAKQGSYRGVRSDGTQADYFLDVAEVRALIEETMGKLEGSVGGGVSPACKECLPASEKQEFPSGSGIPTRQGREGLVAAILGSDTRYQVSPANWRPTSQTGQLTFSGGWCTAALIGPRHILTAGHCVHSGSGGDWYSNFRFYPARSSASVAPLTSYGWRNAWTYHGWTGSSSYDWDIAVIELSAETGMGWLSFGYDGGASTSWYLYHKGYPSDKAYGSMWSTGGYVSDVDSNILWTDTTDTVGGNSGGPWYRYVSGNPVVYAAHSGYYSWWFFGWHTENRHTRITSTKFANFCDWIDDGRVC